MMSPQTPRTESPELGFDADERALAEALRGVPVPEPSAELDARILAMAETAVAATLGAGGTTPVPLSLTNLRARRRSRWGWGMGAATAAVLSALMIAPHWLDRSGVAPTFDAGSGLNHIAPAAPSAAPMAERADRLQPDRAMNATKSEAAPSAVAPSGASASRADTKPQARGMIAERRADPAQSSVEAEPMAAPVPLPAEQAPPAPKPQRQVPAGPATIGPAVPMRASAPPTVIAETVEGNVEAIVVGEAQPDAAESVAASPADALIANDDNAIRHEGLRQREEVPVSNPASSSAAAPAEGASKPRSNETAPMSESTAIPATAPVDPALAQIRQLIADKHTKRAIAAIETWQQQHPTMPLPDDIQQWWLAQAR